LRPFGLCALLVLVSAPYNAMFNNDYVLLEAFAWVAGLLAAVVVIVLALIRRHWKSAASLGLGIPSVFILASILVGLGIDSYQLAFWVSYPYYQLKVSDHQAMSFNWSEGGVFLGGGWENTLKYDPTDQGWSEQLAKSSTTVNRLGLGELTDLRNSTADDCDMRVLRQLGGHWYLDTQYYGGGFDCR
jgi:hypothetical protein